MKSLDSYMLLPLHTKRILGPGPRQTRLDAQSQSQSRRKLHAFTASQHLNGLKALTGNMLLPSHTQHTQGPGKASHTLNPRDRFVDSCILPAPRNTLWPEIVNTYLLSAPHAERILGLPRAECSPLPQAPERLTS